MFKMFYIKMFYIKNYEPNGEMYFGLKCDLKCFLIEWFISFGS